MPKIEQLDWSKLKPATPDKHDKGTKQFPTYEYRQAPKNSKDGDIKITKPPVA